MGPGSPHHDDQTLSVTSALPTIQDLDAFSRSDLDCAAGATWKAVFGREGPSLCIGQLGVLQETNPERTAYLGTGF